MEIVGYNRRISVVQPAQREMPTRDIPKESPYTPSEVMDAVSEHLVDKRNNAMRAVAVADAEVRRREGWTGFRRKMVTVFERGISPQQAIRESSDEAVVLSGALERLNTGDVSVASSYIEASVVRSLRSLVSERQLSARPLMGDGVIDLPWVCSADRGILMLETIGSERAGVLRDTLENLTAVSPSAQVVV